MALFWQIVSSVLLVFLILLFARFVVDWVMVLARSWRPSGLVAAGLEVVYTTTDPPLKAVRKVIPPLNLGSIRLDLGFMVLLIAVVILRSITHELAIGARDRLTPREQSRGTGVVAAARPSTVPVPAVRPEVTCDATHACRRAQRRLQEAAHRQAGLRRGRGRRLPRRRGGRAGPPDRGEQRAARRRRRPRPARAEERPGRRPRRPRRSRPRRRRRSSSRARTTAPAPPGCWRWPPRRPTATSTRPRRRPSRCSAYAAEILKLQPPHITDQPILAQMQRIGIERGKSFDLDKAAPAIKAGLETAPAAASS